MCMSLFFDSYSRLLHLWCRCEKSSLWQHTWWCSKNHCHCAHDSSRAYSQSTFVYFIRSRCWRYAWHYSRKAWSLEGVRSSCYSSHHCYRYCRCYCMLCASLWPAYGFGKCSYDDIILLHANRRKKIGSFANCTLIFIFPVIFYFRLTGFRNKPIYEIAWCALICVLGIVGLIFGTKDSIEGLIKVYQ